MRYDFTDYFYRLDLLHSLACEDVSGEFPSNSCMKLLAPAPIATLRKSRRVLDFDYQVKLDNCSFYQTFQAEPAAVGQRTVSDLGNGRMQTIGKYRLAICALPSVGEGQ